MAEKRKPRNRDEASFVKGFAFGISLLDILLDPKEFIDYINRATASMNDSMAILQGKEPKDGGKDTGRQDRNDEQRAGQVADEPSREDSSYMGPIQPISGDKEVLRNDEAVGESE